jgi:hypothetical protein
LGKVAEFARTSQEQAKAIEELAVNVQKIANELSQNTNKE